MQRIFILGNLRLMCMGRWKPWCNHWNSFTYISTSSTRRAQPMPWLASRDFIWVMPSGIPTYHPACGWSISALGNSSSMGILKQLPSTSGKYITRWQLCVIFARCLPACLHRTSSTIRLDAKQSMEKSVQSMKGMKRPRSPTRKRSQSHKGRMEHLSHLGQMLLYAFSNPDQSVQWMNTLYISESLGITLSPLLSEPSLN